MAATLVMFDKWKEEMLLGNVGLSDTFLVALLSAGWTPSIDTSSVTNSLSTYFCASASGGDAIRSLNPPGGGTLSDQVTKTANGVIKIDFSDVAITASSGVNMDCQYGVIYPSAGAVPFAYWEISSAAITVSQLSITWPAAGLIETSDNV